MVLIVNNSSFINWSGSKSSLCEPQAQYRCDADQVPIPDQGRKIESCIHFHRNLHALLQAFQFLHVVRCSYRTLEMSFDPKTLPEQFLRRIDAGERKRLELPPTLAEVMVSSTGLVKPPLERGWRPASSYTDAEFYPNHPPAGSAPPATCVNSATIQGCCGESF